MSAKRKVEAPEQQSARELRHGFYEGPGQVAYFQGAQVAMALKLWRKGIKLNRRTRLSDLLAIATSLTGSEYPRSKSGAAAAERDLMLVLAKARSEREATH